MQGTIRMNRQVRTKTDTWSNLVNSRYALNVTEREDGYRVETHSAFGPEMHQIKC